MEKTYTLEAVRPARRRERGTSTIEMAIVLPLLILLTFAIGEFGLAFTQWQTLTNATREGARLGVAYRGGTCNAGTVNTEITTTVQNYAAGMGMTTVNVTTNGNECAGAGTQLSVTATYPYSFPMVSAFLGGSPTLNLAATATMRNEG